MPERKARAADRSNPSILVVGIDWPPETFIMRMIDGLVDAGISVTVASHHRPDPEWLSKPHFDWLNAPNWRGNRVGRIVRVGYQMGRAALAGPRGLKRTLSYSSGGTSLAQRLRISNRLLPFTGRRWDIVYFPWNTAAIEYLPVFDADQKVVLSCRGSQVNIAPHNPDRNITTGLRQTFHRAAAVHCVSEAIYRQAVKYGLDPSKAHVIKPAVDPQVFLPADHHSDDRLRVVTTASLIWTKGYEYSLQAIRNLVDEGIPIRYEIIGDGPDKQRVTYTVHDLQLQDHVLLSGRLEPWQVRDRLQRSDIFVLTSVSEGISNALLEAMSCGLPVVTSDCGGMGEAVTDDVEGFVVPIRNAEATATALRKLCSSEALRKRMGSAGRQRIEREHNLAQQTGAFVELFTRLGRS